MARKFLLSSSSSDSEGLWDTYTKLIEEDAEAEAECSSHPRCTRTYIQRNRVNGNERLMKDYFDDNPVFTNAMFRRRFRMNKHLFIKILQGISNHSIYFQQRNNCVGEAGLSPYQKCTAALCQLAYGIAADGLDEYIRIGETTATECLKKFCASLIAVYKKTYMRRPSVTDIERLCNKNSEKHGFPGMLGSIDCMHWAWKNCPTAWKGQFTRGDHGHPTIMLEAVASYDLWIWHAFFGVTGSNNDLNVLNQSPLFNDVLKGVAPECHFMVNQSLYTKGYYLADGIYPEWATFVKTFSQPDDVKRKKFKKAQESARKDVERAFGVLQSRWAIARGPARSWSLPTIRDIMYACVILHNMIVEDEGYAISAWSDDVTPPIEVSRGFTYECQHYLQNNASIRDNQTHHNLRADLVEHIWQYGRD